MSVVESDKLLYSVQDAAYAIGRTSRAAVYELIHTGRLRAVRDRGRTLIPRESILEYVASLPAHDPGEGNDAT